MNFPQLTESRLFSVSNQQGRTSVTTYADLEKREYMPLTLDSLLWAFQGACIQSPLLKWSLSSYWVSLQSRSWTPLSQNLASALRSIKLPLHWGNWCSESSNELHLKTINVNINIKTVIITIPETLTKNFHGQTAPSEDKT